VFRNYYTAWVTVLARLDSGYSCVLPQEHPNMSNNAGPPQEKLFVPTSKGTVSSMKLTEQIGGWVVAVPHRVLMANPHLENGSNDFVSIPSTEVISLFVLKVQCS